jgi:hypothetical protein
MRLAAPPPPHYIAVRQRATPPLQRTAYVRA